MTSKDRYNAGAGAGAGAAADAGGVSPFFDKLCVTVVPTGGDSDAGGPANMNNTCSNVDPCAEQASSQPLQRQLTLTSLLATVTGALEGLDGGRAERERQRREREEGGTVHE